MQKSEKSLEPFLRKLRYQPTNQLLPTTPILLDLADAGPIKKPVNYAEIYEKNISLRFQNVENKKGHQLQT